MNEGRAHGSISPAASIITTASYTISGKCSMGTVNHCLRASITVNSTNKVAFVVLLVSLVRSRRLELGSRDRVKLNGDIPRPSKHFCFAPRFPASSGGCPELNLV